MTTVTRLALALLLIVALVVLWRRRHRAVFDEPEWTAWDPWLEQAGRA